MARHKILDFVVNLLLFCFVQFGMNEMAQFLFFKVCRFWVGFAFLPHFQLDAEFFQDVGLMKVFNMLNVDAMITIFFSMCLKRHVMIRTKGGYCGTTYVQPPP